MLLEQDRTEGEVFENEQNIVPIETSPKIGDEDEVAARFAAILSQNGLTPVTVEEVDMSIERRIEGARPEEVSMETSDYATTNINRVDDYED